MVRGRIGHEVQVLDLHLFEVSRFHKEASILFDRAKTRSCHGIVRPFEMASVLNCPLSITRFAFPACRKASYAVSLHCLPRAAAGSVRLVIRD